ncbi:MAG: DegT/DnrJ/EryC1/StrS family aminotransferase [Deltaproteobacteria bacterium]|nr:DegT/DnrJ/EryC1/StrS family aminotransferase [Deltaproteobacteria bacterium]
MNQGAASPSARAAAIAALVEQFGALDVDAPAPADSLPLALAPFGKEEVAEAISALLEGQLTMGPRVAAFERAWADYIGVQHAVAVNSGSSALLVMLAGLIELGRLQRGQRVIVPAVGWSTSLFSVAQAGLVPVLADVDPDSLGLEGDFDDPVLAVHLLGCPSRARSPLLLEDACGAHGAEVDGRRVGGRGAAGAFSFFFSHHISTVEGGAVTTDDAELADAMRSLRAHGWVRERSDKAALVAQHPEIDERFLFVSAGYNLRMPDLCGAFGVHQVRRLPGFLDRRRANHAAWCAQISALNLPLRVFPELPGTTHAAFAFPMVLDADSPLSRPQLCARLEARGISTRPISGANLARQPAFARLPAVELAGPLPVADAVHDRGLFVGQSHAFDERHGALLAEALAEAFRGA